MTEWYINTIGGRGVLIGGFLSGDAMVALGN
jgi:hypothetical protein